ncbi:MAG: PCRF domain-containing protein, partial [Dehalococcoidia bacterium]
MEESVLAELQRVRERFEAITREMAEPDVAANYERMTELARERSDLAAVVELLDRYESASDDATSAASVLESDDDEDMRALAREEVTAAKATMANLEDKLRRALLPRDPRDDRNVIVEIRGGAGGEEAALFAADLFRMYTRYAEKQGWKVEPL